jgi:hypothetical protein
MCMVYELHHKKGNVIKHQYNKILKKERIQNRNFTFETTNILESLVFH